MLCRLPLEHHSSLCSTLKQCKAKLLNYESLNVVSKEGRGYSVIYMHYKYVCLYCNEIYFNCASRQLRVVLQPPQT